MVSHLLLEDISGLDSTKSVIRRRVRLVRYQRPSLGPPAPHTFECRILKFATTTDMNSFRAGGSNREGVRLSRLDHIPGASELENRTCGECEAIC